MSRAQKENPLINIAVNIFLPVMVLNQSAKWEHPWAAEILLLVALSLPLGYGIWDWLKFRRRNFISVLGIFNVMLTGGFALFELSPFWFVIKEASLPFVLGVGVLLSKPLSGRPFFETLLRDSGAFNWEKLDLALQVKGLSQELNKLFVKCNYLFSSSFFISALLNFLLANHIFQSIATDLPDSARKQVLNQQIADMTWQGWVVIALPLMLFMMLIFLFFFSRIKQLSGFDLDDLTANSN